jgi:hypothetical protein
MDEIKLEELTVEIEGSCADAQADNPDVGTDDIFHDVADSICTAHYGEMPEEVNEFWRRNFGETWDERQREMRDLARALGDIIKEEDRGTA